MDPIRAIQGDGLYSPLVGRAISTCGVVIGYGRKGFYIQDPAPPWNATHSDGLFVFSRRERPPQGALVEVAGRVVDWQLDEGEHPTTQLSLEQVQIQAMDGPAIEPFWLDAETLPASGAEVARLLNALEGMLVGVPAGSTFVAPSNPFGDYVVAPPGLAAPRTKDGGVLVEPANAQRWLPSFRVRDLDVAPRVDVGATLVEPIAGPLNFRASSFQIEAQIDARTPLRFSSAQIQQRSAQLVRDAEHITVMTLNGFNLDEQHESPALVHDARRDVDDDVGDGRFRSLARAIVRQAASPDIVALQEIQDDDGAELTKVVSAGETYRLLAQAVRGLGGPSYRWAELPPAAGEDGGQPGGNIRNAFLYDSDRLELVAGSLARLGENDPAYEDSRKSLLAHFRAKASKREIVVVNVHFASKRRQRGIFAASQPGHDPRLPVRVRQAEIVRQAIVRLAAQDLDYYVTGDFNAFEFSETLGALVGDESTNLVESLPPEGRYDYNHRGKLQALMHGVVSRRQAERGAAEYEILHGNELTGVDPGELGTKPTDHAYAIARLRLS